MRSRDLEELIQYNEDLRMNLQSVFDRIKKMPFGDKEGPHRYSFDPWGVGVRG